ncbi:Signaling ykoW [Fusarium albosuccineum]|uniref:Signaling ykoW n=1 Tax=Fusarium albosuccineum TaxID=1237068 RepID=A0A8H4PAF2_9HYPO|nr:Signaling ykoW [Fusarium albosuccineum]
MSTQDLLREYQGHIVPQSYNAGFVALSYVVSLVGAASTLELINRRTGLRGLFNHVLLVGSAVTMGGVSIWCMHFIGNRAIDLAHGESDLQVAYSSGFTAVSFFVPILVLLTAFIAVGTNNVVSWWRLSSGGILCGTAVCGMHYLGNASIDNYTCVYRPAYVVGSAIIAVVASNVALAMFFVFRAMWANSWWKRVISAVVLAGAVSGMHWCAAVGTRYRLVKIKPDGNEPSRTATVVVVICLSLGACFVIAVSATLRARNLRRSALRAQQIALGAAIFDKAGRILVDPDGYIPSTVVTDSFLEKSRIPRKGSASATRFSTGCFKHQGTGLPHSRTHKDGRRGIQLVNEHGEMIESYDMIFRELFCLAAAALADRLREDLTSVGVLWDDILPTGENGKRPRQQLYKPPNTGLVSNSGDANEDSHGSPDMAEKGIGMSQHNYGRGSLMFLVRRAESDRDSERLVSAGYRFAELHQVSDIIRSSMQIQSHEFETKLQDMATYTSEPNQTLPGVHVGFFAVRARVSSGFEVLVRKGVRSLLPTMALPFKSLEDWHNRYLGKFGNMPVSKIAQKCKENLQCNTQEAEFAGHLSDTINSLREWIQEPLFEDAVMTPTIVRIPCRGEEGRAEATMITMRLVIPIHSVLTSPNCEFVPLGFFKMRQVSTQFHHEFIRGIHQEFGHVANTVDYRKESKGNTAGLTSKLRRLGRQHPPGYARRKAKSMSVIAGRQVPSSDSTRSSSTINLCPPEGGNRTRSIDSANDSGTCRAPEESPQAPPSYGGIMVFQEITIDVEEGNQTTVAQNDTESSDTVTMEKTNSKPSPATGIELQSVGHVGTNVQAGPHVSNGVEARKGVPSHVASFVDVLFAETVESR